MWRKPCGNRGLCLYPAGLAPGLAARRFRWMPRCTHGFARRHFACLRPSDCARGKSNSGRWRIGGSARCRSGGRSICCPDFSSRGRLKSPWSQPKYRRRKSEPLADLARGVRRGQPYDSAIERAVPRSHPAVSCLLSQRAGGAHAHIHLTQVATLADRIRARGVPAIQGMQRR